MAETIPKGICFALCFGHRSLLGLRAVCCGAMQCGRVLMRRGSAVMWKLVGGRICCRQHWSSLLGSMVVGQGLWLWALAGGLLFLAVYVLVVSF
ncbi:hypothetical protein RchiOBHm_Chr4g0390481 [Rosa chinensis]|uniref:Uncharacterized protein n=1 Tax=Rosa chinensis TaxID=74649 RepID=A0A2P6QQ84_ROSCH|nr:hypothetical protein RchiOBHm_Chr4g0390481 [Rosa chinensis]